MLKTLLKYCVRFFAAIAEPPRRDRYNEQQNMIAVGRVASHECDDSKADVRILFPDREDFISKPGPVIQRSGGGKRSYDVPRVGQSVLVARLPGAVEENFVLGSFYTTADPPPITDPNMDYIEYDDGSVVSFDPKTATMTWMIKGPINLTATGGPITLTTDGQCTITAPEIKLAGNVTITGNLTVEGETSMQQATANPNCKNTDGSGNGT